MYVKLEIAYSPCPNDTYIFDAMVHGRIDTEGLTFEPVLADVETLNEAAFAKTYPVTKLSYAALAHLQQVYRLLDAGSALGDGIGPLLIADKPLDDESLMSGPVAIPGAYTTAAFLFRLAYPEHQHLKPIIYSEIEAAIRSQEVLAGVIIHESRFTYAERGFHLIQDLGSFWQRKTGLPIPLGGIVVRRDLPLDLQQKIGRVLERSIRFANTYPEFSQPYVAANAQEMSVEMQYKHIKTYVNDFSLSLGVRGRAAVSGLFQMAWEKGLTGPPADDLLVLPGALAE